MMDGRVWRVAAAVLLAGAALTQGAAAPEAQPWHHALLEPKADAGLIMTAGQGFAEKQGLKLDFVPLKSDIPMLQALLSGAVDSYEGGPASAMIAASHGADVKIIGCYWQGLPHGIFAKASTASVKDLKGKVFAISSPGALPDLLVRAVLDKNGMAPTDVTFANLGSDNDRFKALAAGVAQAAVVSGEYTPIAEQQGLKFLIRGRDVMPDYMRLCSYSTGKTLAAHHDAAVHFVAAEIAGMRYALGHRDETLALTRKLTDGKADDPRPGFMFDYTVETKAIDPDWSIPMDKLTWMMNQTVETGNLTKPIDLEKMIDPTIREQALALLAKTAQGK